MELGHTRVVLQAISFAEAVCADCGGDVAVRKRAEIFLRLLQRHPDESRNHPIPPDWDDTVEAWQGGRAGGFDGGFYFSPIALSANKGHFDKERPHWRSYATATCDGLLSLLALGDDRTDARIQAAARWLAKHPDLDYPQGVPRDQPEPWGAAIYHYAVRAQVYDAINWPGEWRAQLRSLIAARQNADGSFINRDSHLMKEDDPLLCTALAVTALTRAAE
jgi:hypothetical protein